MIITTPIWDKSCVEFLAKPNGSNVDKSGTTVYEPAEDTFLMLDALQLDLEFVIRNRLLNDAALSIECKPLMVIELGSGAGLVITAVAKALSDCKTCGVVGVHCVAVDLNPAACLTTARTCELNDVQVDVLRGDLLTWMKQYESTYNSLSGYGPIDLLLFNPPYVRGADGEGVPSIARLNISGGNMMSDHQLAMMTDAAWLGGGPNGVDVLQRALHQAADMLSERGVFYVLMIDYNYKALVMNELSARRKRNDENDSINIENYADFIVLTTYGSCPEKTPLVCKHILSRRIPGEHLAVYRLYRPHIVDSITKIDVNQSYFI